MIAFQSRSASRALTVAACGWVLGLLAACSGDESGPGSPSSGGSTGSPAQGGVPTTGGAAALGGASVGTSGGTTTGGSSVSSGGAGTAGGVSTGGGGASSGGSATGGARTGGDAGMAATSGGTLATGGSASAGGGSGGSSAGSGGVPASGGVSASGGKASGGAGGAASGAGGASSSGGKASGGAGSGSGGAGGSSASGGTGGGACPYTGHVTYTLAKAANPSAAQTTAYGLITTAMDKALGYYNCYTNITKSLNVVYEPSVQTADGNINGSLRFGSNTTYMDYRTAMHEIGHTVGIGQASNWASFLANGLFTGSNALAQLQAINATLQTPLYTEVHADTQHFWPYGLNQQSEVKSEADLIAHCKMVVAIRKDLGL